MTTNPVRAAIGESGLARDIENALLDLDGIGALLLDVAASLDTGSLPSTRSLYFLGTSICDRSRTLAGDLGMGLFQKGGEDRS